MKNMKVTVSVSEI